MGKELARDRSSKDARDKDRVSLTTLSLDQMLDYDEDDTKEGHFEVGALVALMRCCLVQTPLP